MKGVKSMSELNENSKNRLVVFDSVSTDKLEEILRQDSELPGEDGYDMGAIVYISELIARREMEHPTGKFSDVNTAWESFMKDYYPIPCEIRKTPDGDGGQSETVSDMGAAAFEEALPKRRSSFHQITRAASIAAIVAIVLLAGTVTAYAMGFDLRGMFARWTDGTFSFTSAEKASRSMVSSRADQEYYSLKDALIANNIEIPLTPTWMPEGFEQTELRIDAVPCTTFYASYACGERLISVSINEINKDGMFIYQKDEEPVDRFFAGGVTHYIMSNLSSGKAVWANGDMECSISGDLSREELERMIESIYDEQDKQ